MSTPQDKGDILTAEEIRQELRKIREWLIDPRTPVRSHLRRRWVAVIEAVLFYEI